MSVQRVMQLDTWMNTAWRLSFRSIRDAHWPLFLWHVWHHSFKYCYHILSRILLLLCHLTVTCRMKLNVMVILQRCLDFRTFTWCVRPLQMHRGIIMSHNLVTELKQKQTRSKIGKQIAFTAIRRQKLQFAPLFCCRRRSRHHLVVRIRYLYGN